jgi:hypothetical protein
MQENTQTLADLHAFGDRLYFRLTQFTGTQDLSLGRVDATGANLVPALIPASSSGPGSRSTGATSTGTRAGTVAGMAARHPAAGLPERDRTGTRTGATGARVCGPGNG